MLSVQRPVVALSMVGFTFALAPSVAADDDPPVVVHGGNGWIESKVIDLGSLGAKPKALPARRAAARTCTQTKSPTAGGYATQEQFDSGAPPGAGPGGWVVRHCSDGTLDIAWVPATPLVDAPVTPAQLAQRATNRLRLPLPEPQFEPRRASSAGPTTLVAIPTWFFLGSWAPVSQRTAAGGVWAEVSAEPVETTWWPGDGSAAVHCTGGGRAWSQAERSAASCRYSYTRSSAAQADNVYLARVEVTWRISWSGSGGVRGTLPLMQRQNTFPVAVAERQTVIVGGGSS